MIDAKLDAQQSILHVRPTGALAQADFEKLARTVDAHLEANGALRGIIIEAPQFPGWESLGAMAAHLRFVREHHKKVAKVAVVTDSALGTLAERLASHFVSAQIRAFAANERDAAQKWVLGN